MDVARVNINNRMLSISILSLHLPARNVQLKTRKELNKEAVSYVNITYSIYQRAIGGIATDATNPHPDTHRNRPFPT